MIDHVGIWISDITRAKPFYERLLAPLGYELRNDLSEGASFRTHEVGRGDPHGDFWINQVVGPFRREHIAFTAENIEQIQRFHAAGLAAGGTDNGAPGPRPNYAEGYYAAFILDPDGNNIEAVLHDHKPEPSSDGSAR